MKVIEYEHHLEYFSSGIFGSYFGGLDFCVFDIETLGLNPSRSEMILAGVMTVEKDGRCRLAQFFAEDTSDEKELLLTVEEYLNQFSYIITYNGRHFDVPYIKKRAEVNGLDGFEIKPYNLDIYLIVNGHSPFRNTLKSLKQSSIEEYMGVSSGRLDKISGKESVDLYYQYLLCSDPCRKAAVMDSILLHNHDDLIQLYRILPVVRQTNFHGAMNSLGFPVKGKNSWPDLDVRSLRVSARDLTVSGTYAGKPVSYTCYSSPDRLYDCSFSPDKTFRFDFPVYNYRGNVFINARELMRDTSCLERYAGYVNGFLVLTENNKKNSLEINMISKELIHRFMVETPAV